MKRIIVRRDSAEAWAEIDPVLDALEPALDTTNDIMKLGDGVHRWSELPGYRKSNHLIDPTEEASIEEMTHTSRIRLRNRLTDLIYRHNVKYHLDAFDPEHKTCGDGCQ